MGTNRSEGEFLAYPHHHWTTLCVVPIPTPTPPSLSSSSLSPFSIDDDRSSGDGTAVVGDHEKDLSSMSLPCADIMVHHSKGKGGKGGHLVVACTLTTTTGGDDNVAVCLYRIAPALGLALADKGPGPGPDVSWRCSLLARCPTRNPHLNLALILAPKVTAVQLWTTHSASSSSLSVSSSSSDGYYVTITSQQHHQPPTPSSSSSSSSSPFTSSSKGDNKSSIANNTTIDVTIVQFTGAIDDNDDDDDCHHDHDNGSGVSGRGDGSDGIRVGHNISNGGGVLSAWESCHRVVCLGSGLAPRLGLVPISGLASGPSVLSGPSWRLLHPPLPHYNHSLSHEGVGVRVGVLSRQYVFLGDTNRPQVENPPFINSDPSTFSVLPYYCCRTTIITIVLFFRLFVFVVDVVVSF